MKNFEKITKKHLTNYICYDIIVNCSYVRFYGFSFVHNHVFEEFQSRVIMHFYCVTHKCFVSANIDKINFC